MSGRCASWRLRACTATEPRPSGLSAAQSGRALELMNQGLIWFADNLRVSYGAGLLELARMMIRASNRYRYAHTRSEFRRSTYRRGSVSNGPVGTRRLPRTGCATHRRCACWPPSAAISRETALKSIADVYDIEDVPAELARIAAERAP